MTIPAVIQLGRLQEKQRLPFHPAKSSQAEFCISPRDLDPIS